MKIYGANEQALYELQGEVITRALAGIGVEGEAREALEGEALDAAVTVVKRALEAEPRLV